MKKLLALIPFLAVLTGCSLLPLRPGVSRVNSTGAYVRQPQNPKQGSTQKYEKITETLLPPEPGKTNRVILRTTERVDTTIGAAQKDTAREAAEKLASLSGVVWVGLIVFLFGAASFVYPPLKIIVGGSTTTSAVITASGLSLIILPSLLVGHELLILSVAGGAALLYFFAHRHGSVSGALKALKDDARSVV
jgi:hypothetical protein